MDDFSIESLYEMGLGLKSNNATSRVSVEDWDGDHDALAYEMASAESMIDTMDVYSRISALNADQQIKCAHRISANYGNCNRGIESFCNNVILSAESDAATAGADTKSDDKKDAAKDEKNDEKKTSFFKKLFGAMAVFFRKIWQFICSIPSRIKAFIQHIRQHGLKGAGTAAGAAGNAKMADMENKYQAKKNQLGNEIEAALKEINGIIKNLDGTIKEFCNFLNKASKTEGIKEDTAKILKIMSNMAKEGFIIIQRVCTAVEYGARLLVKENEELKEIITKIVGPNIKPLVGILKEYGETLKKSLSIADKLEIDADTSKEANEMAESYFELIIDAFAAITDKIYSFCKKYVGSEVSEMFNFIKNSCTSGKAEMVKYIHQSKMMMMHFKNIEAIVTKILNAVNKFYTDKSVRDAISSAMIGAASVINFEAIGKDISGAGSKDTNAA